MTLIEKIKPYVYHITHEPTGVCYVGSRGSNKVTSKEDFWNIYFTSSVKVKGLIEEYGVESFKIDWITEYETSQQAVEEEEKFQHEKDVVNNDLYLNQAIWPYLDTTGENNGFYGKTHTEESKKKQSESKKGVNHSGENNPMYGKKHTDETRQQISDAGKGKNNSMYGTKRIGENNPMYGKSNKWGKHSPETKKKMSEAVQRRLEYRNWNEYYNIVKKEA